MKIRLEGAELSRADRDITMLTAAFHTSAKALKKITQLHH